MSTIAISSSIPVAQRASWLPDCSQLDSLAEKYSSNWQTNVLIVGVVGAVASAVGALFLNMAAFGVAFVALASILAYGAYCAHNSNQHRAVLEQTVTELREQKQKLETDKNTLTATAARLQTQFTQVQSTNNHLNHTVNTLQANAGNLESRNNALTLTSSTLQGEVDTLKHNQANLQHRVTQLQSAIPLLKNQIAEFADQNVKLGKDLSIADIETIKTDPLADELKGSDPQVQELAEQIQRAKAVSAKLFSTFDSQRKIHLQQLEALTTSHGNLENFEKKLQEQRLTLTNVEQQISEKANNLKNIDENFAQAKLSLENKTREIDEAQRKLNAIVADFTKAEEGLASVKQELLTFTQQQEDLKLLNEKLQKTQTSFEDTKKSLREEAGKLDRLKNDLTLTQADVEFAKTELLAYPQKLEELKKLNNELAVAKTSFEETKRSIEVEAAALNELKLEVYAAQTELTNAQKELESHAEKQAELKKLHEELSQVQSTLNDTKKAGETENVKLEELQAQIAIKQAELDAILENIRNGTDLLQKKSSNLELRQAEKFQKAQQELAALNSEIGQKKAELEKLNPVII